MNVWGSGGAHSVYFDKIDEIVLAIFNRPIEEQPLGIADMGCGNGAFLEHLHEVIVNQSLRGTMLNEHPLLVIGSDFNDAALEATRITLTKAGIEFHVLHGDIGNPKELADNLKDSFGVNLGDMLNVRSFLDHNRMYHPPQEQDYQRNSISSGAFAFRGRRIPNSEVEQNLFEHFRKWLPYVHRFGLLVIELHTIPPNLAAQNLGRTAITAYDGTHGYSDQYIVELDVFLEIAKEAGLNAVPNYSAKYPPSDLATVSINLLRSD
jgi:SAM-dependent methyltransferase